MTRIIKLGGSLLDFEGLVPALRAWLARQTPATSLLIVGGGKLAEAVRDADRLHGLDPSAAHWLAVETMGINARLVHALLPESRFSANLSDIADGKAGASLWTFDPRAFLVNDEQQPGRLPHGWNVTSDSIAARLAVRCGAKELVLLKSRLPGQPATFASVAKEGYVDPHFPHAADPLAHVRCVGMRGDLQPEVLLRS